MPLKRIAIFISLLLTFTSCDVPDRSVAQAPLPHVKLEYEKADFWIKQAQTPDKAILTSGQIVKRNRSALKPGSGLVDIFTLPEKLDSTYFTSEFDKVKAATRTYKRYDHGSNPVPQRFYTDLFSTFQTKNLPESITPVYGLITTAASLRELPTDEITMEGPFDTEFDYFQYSRLELGTPVAVLHFTHDRSWCFVQTPFANGWVRGERIGIGSKAEVARFASAPPLVITGKMISLYSEADFSNFMARIQMGGRLPLETKASGYYQVTLPFRDSTGKLIFSSGFIRPKADVHKGFLRYTHRAILRQAFKIRGTPYGWGGMFDGMDCSQFLMSVFRTFGFNFPRNSWHQANFPLKTIDVSKMNDAQKIEMLQKQENTPTVLYLKGHIMLFLGVIDGRAYAIHSTWAYRKKILFKDRIFYIGKNVVSDLSLGEGSKRGSLLSRILTIVPIE